MTWRIPCPRLHPSTAFSGLVLVTSLAGAASIPETPRQPVVDVYHGQEVIDEYRWLEDASDPMVQAWSDAQNEAARAYLDALPARPAILGRLEAITGEASARYFSLTFRAGRWFALKEEPPKHQPILVRLSSPDDLSGERVLVDPNTLDPSGQTTIDFFEPSLDGRLVAVSLSEGGSESGTVSVFEVETGARLPDRVPAVNGGTAGGSVAWWPDGRGFLRTRYPQAGEVSDSDLGFFEQVYEHHLGSPADSDGYVFGRELPRIAEIFLQSSEDGRVVVADVLNGDGGEHAFWLRRGQEPFRRLTRFEDGYVQATLGDDHLFLLERWGAPRGRVVRVPLAATSLEAAEEIVPESEATIDQILATPSLLYVVEVDGGPSRVRMVDHQGVPRGEIPLPPLVSVRGLVRTEEDMVLLRQESYTTPPVWSWFDPGHGTLRPTALVWETRADLSGVEVLREFAVSKDGTKVPLTILMAQSTPRDGTAPAILTGYGGFGISLSPSFDERRLLWLEQGGVIAIANLRGGGEYGDDWHFAGNLLKKQNVFDDLDPCAVHLVTRKYADPDRIAIEGGSNGGLLMGAELTQHPQLYRAVVSHAGIYDMLRNELTPNGSFNVTEYGSVKDPEQFRALHAYSPYHRVKDGIHYPAVLFLHGANDPRVDPFHSRKMTARLQAATTSGRPILLRTSSTTGHGSGTPYSERNAQDADVYAFLFDQLGMTWKETGTGE